MDPRRQKAEAVAKKYMRVGTLLKDLGSGAEGFVFPSYAATAVKIFAYEEKFARELAAYERLNQCEIDDVLGFSVPRLVTADRALLVIEMTIVEPPFLLDFAQASIDAPFDFVEGGELEWWESVAANFGDDFERARDVFYSLVQRAELYYYDLAPRNLNFGKPR